MKNLDRDIERVCFSAGEIAKRVRELGEEITRDYEEKDLVVVAVLKGSFVFAADLLREIDLPCDFEVMRVSSYGAGTESSGSVKIISDLDEDISGRHVLMIEDILDTGVTLTYLRDHVFAARNTASFKICAMFDKTQRRTCDIRADYRGFETPGEFIVGYGLDYNQKYRNLPYVGVLKPEIYKKKM